MSTNDPNILQAHIDVQTELMERRAMTYEAPDPSRPLPLTEALAALIRDLEHWQFNSGLNSQERRERILSVLRRAAVLEAAAQKQGEVFDRTAALADEVIDRWCPSFTVREVLHAAIADDRAEYDALRAALAGEGE